MSPRASGIDAERWPVVGERCAEAIVALCRVRAVYESGQMVFDHTRRSAQARSACERPQLQISDLDEQRERLARALWGCGHAWRRAARESATEVAEPRIGPALAAGYDEYVTGAGALVAVDPNGAATLLMKRVAEVMQESMPFLRAAIQALKPAGEPDLAVVADDLTAVIQSLAGAPDGA